jgi:hypothetical protein
MYGDMLLRTDSAQLWALRDGSNALVAVMDDHKTRMREKYLGSPSEFYPRKNWSSVAPWNCAHQANRQITPEFVAKATGARMLCFTLHQENSRAFCCQHRDIE